jgi:hypothetical protein
MRARDSMLKLAKPYLLEGEQIQAIFSAQTAHPSLLIASNSLTPAIAAGVLAGLSSGLGSLELILIGVVVGLVWSTAVGVIMHLTGGNRHRIFVVTSGRMLVMDASPSDKKVRGVIPMLPRSTRLGPPSGLWYRLPLDGQTLRTHQRQFVRVFRRQFKEIREADRLLPGSVTASLSGQPALLRWSIVDAGDWFGDHACHDFVLRRLPVPA